MRKDTCVLPLVCLSQPREPKSRKKEKKNITCQPNVNFEDAWTAGGGETKRGSKEGGKNCDCKTHLVIFGKRLCQNAKNMFYI